MKFQIRSTSLAVFAGAMFLTLAGLNAADKEAPHDGVMMKDGKMMEKPE